VTDFLFLTVEAVPKSSLAKMLLKNEKFIPHIAVGANRRVPSATFIILRNPPNHF
jgi:hypothetical protein